jgi:hypothetical protein
LLEVEVMLWPTVTWPVCLGVGHPSGPHRQIFIIAGHLQVSCCGAPSLMRGWLCNLLIKLLLSLANTVTLRSKSQRTHDHILLSHLRLHNLEQCQSCQSPGYLATDGQAASLSWCQATIWGSCGPHEKQLGQNQHKTPPVLLYTFPEFGCCWETWHLLSCYPVMAVI